MNDEERQQFEVTLATLRELATRALDSPVVNDHSRGYCRAMQDVKAVLDKHGAPVGEPVIFGASW